MRRRDPDHEARIAWVDKYCPMNKLCSGPHDLSSLCWVKNRDLAAWAASGWVASVQKDQRNSVERKDAAALVVSQWRELREQLGKVARYESAKR